MNSDLPSARDVLAPGDPLCRILEQIDTLRMQTVVCLALLAGATAGAYPAVTHAGALAVADTVVVVVLGCLVLLLRGERYRRARSVLIERGGADLAELQDVRRRLERRVRREQLSDALDEALHCALVWPTIPVARRPPPGVRHLAVHVPAVRMIVASLRTDVADVADVRGIAMLEALLDGGYAAAVYHLDARALGEQLQRIRYALASRPPR